MALASGFEVTGLAEWFGVKITLLDTLPLVLLILIVIFSVNFITELTSNLASTAMLLPILAPIALKLNLNPIWCLLQKQLLHLMPLCFRWQHLPTQWFLAQATYVFLIW